MNEKPGVFVLSLDTELAWGTFDVGRLKKFERAYRKTPDVIECLCELLDEYQISATWALVSHLLVDCNNGQEHAGRILPNFEWVDDWFGEMPCASGCDPRLWYAPWLVERIASCDTEQEIGLHGATHMPLGAQGCSRQNAKEEIQTAVETVLEYGIEPKTFVFPRNEIGHTDVLAEHGIRAYRGMDARWYEQWSLPDVARPPLRFVDEAIRRTPPVVEPIIEEKIVEIPGSQVFRPTQGGWRYIPGESSVLRAKKGLYRAARTGGVFHMWFHPFNLAHASSRDLRRFEYVLNSAKDLIQQEAIESRSMSEVAALAQQGRWG